MSTDDNPREDDVKLHHNKDGAKLQQEMKEDNPRAVSKCCNSELLIGGDNREGTHYYVCSKCKESCDSKPAEPVTHECKPDHNGECTICDEPISPKCEHYFEDDNKRPFWKLKNGEFHRVTDIGKMSKCPYCSDEEPVERKGEEELLDQLIAIDIFFNFGPKEKEEAIGLITGFYNKARSDAYESCAVIAETWRASVYDPRGKAESEEVEAMCNSMSENIAAEIRRLSKV